MGNFEKLSVLVIGVIIVMILVVALYTWTDNPATEAIGDSLKTQFNAWTATVDASDAGADFIQTQMIYNAPKFREFMKRVVDLGTHEETYILAGVGPLKTPGAAKYMRDKVPGMDVPEEVIKRLQGAEKGKVAAEGIKMACEQIEEFKELKGVDGVHLMAIEWEHKVPEIAERANVLPRPQVD